MNRPAITIKALGLLEWIGQYMEAALAGRLDHRGLRVRASVPLIPPLSNAQTLPQYYRDPHPPQAQMAQEATTTATGSITSLAATPVTQHPPTPVVVVVAPVVKQYHGSVVAVLPPPDLDTEAMFLRCSELANEGVQEWARDRPWW
jgi:hypothetical protein